MGPVGQHIAAFQKDLVVTSIGDRFHLLVEAACPHSSQASCTLRSVGADHATRANDWITIVSALLQTCMGSRATAV
jgi:hypothetical protein